MPQLLKIKRKKYKKKLIKFKVTRKVGTLK